MIGSPLSGKGQWTQHAPPQKPDSTKGRKECGESRQGPGKQRKQDGASKQHSLLLQEIDELNVPVLAKVALELVLAEDLEVLDVAHVHVPSRTAVH